MDDKPTTDPITATPSATDPTAAELAAAQPAEPTGAEPTGAEPTEPTTSAAASVPDPSAPTVPPAPSTSTDAPPPSAFPSQPGYFPATDTPPPTSTPPPSMRLRRSRSNRMLGGVCGGLSEVLKVDAVIPRLALVLVTVLGFGIGVVLYLAGWILMPREPEHPAP